MNRTQLGQLLIDQGHASATGVSRTARFRLCANCDQVILRGLDDPKCAGEAYVDPTPLSALGEVAELLAGRSTYSLRRCGGRLELDHRNRWRISGAPAASGRFDVVADHACGISYAGALACPTRIPDRNHRKDNADDLPPY